MRSRSSYEATPPVLPRRSFPLPSGGIHLEWWCEKAPDAVVELARTVRDSGRSLGMDWAFILGQRMIPARRAMV